MKNKILALTFFVCSFAVMQQASAQQTASRAHLKLPVCQCMHNQPQIPCEERDTKPWPGNPNRHIGAEQCVFDCHCHQGNKCVGADTEKNIVGKCVGPFGIGGSAR